MISAQKINKLLLFLCKHLPPKDVEKMKSEIESILGFDIEKMAEIRRMRKERERMTDALSRARIAYE